MKTGFECLFYYVTDLDLAIEFYETHLGLHLVRRGALARFEIDGVTIELAPSPGSSATGTGGNARLCLSVENLGAAADELQAGGVCVGEIQVVEGGSWLAVVDPDDNEIVLWQGDRD